MAYNGGYEAQGRPYAGPAAARPAPQQRQQFPPGPPGPGRQQQYNGPPPQQYDQYQDDYGYGYDDGYGANGYDQGYGEQYDEMNYGRGPPPNQNYPPQQDYYGPPPGRGGPPRGRGRGGGPMGRPPPPGGQYPSRSGGPGPGRGGYPPARGGRPPVERHGNSDPTGDRRPPMDPMSPVDSGFGGSGAYPSFPGGRPKNDMQQDLSHQMEGMDISGGQRPPPVRNGMGGSRGPMPPPSGDGYGGRPPMDGSGRGPRQYPPQDYPDQRRGAPPGPGYGPPNDYPEDNFGPPGRSMTMPAREPQMEMRSARPPPRGDSIPYNAPRPGPGRGMGMGMPPRPSTAQAMRPPPQDMYPPSNGPPPPGPYQEPGYENAPPQDPGYRGQQQRPASYDDFYDYYNGRGSGDYGPPQHRGSGQSGMGGFDAGPPQNVQSPPPQGAPGQPQRVAARVPEVSRTKSQPDLRQPQAAVFEMAGDMPPIPTHYQQQRSGAPQQGQGYGQPGPGPAPGEGLPSNPGEPYQEGPYGRRRSYDQGGPTGGPSLPNNPGQYRPGAQPSSTSVHSASSADTHPMPVRAGLMPNSVVNLNSGKPPPVRNYNGVNGVAAPASIPSQAPQPAHPQVHQQAQLPQQPPTGVQAQPAKPKEPPVTVEELDRLKAKIKTTPADQESALTLAKKLCEAADVLVSQLPDPKSRARARERYLVDAQKILKKLSSNGNMHAMFFMADCLGRGLFGAEPDNKDAFLLYQSAAKQGHAAAAYRTAVCCEIGNEEGGGTRKDPLKAIQWYKRACLSPETMVRTPTGNKATRDIQVGDMLLDDEDRPVQCLTVGPIQTSLNMKTVKYQEYGSSKKVSFKCTSDHIMTLMVTSVKPFVAANSRVFWHTRCDRSEAREDAEDIKWDQVMHGLFTELSTELGCRPTDGEARRYIQAITDTRIIPDSQDEDSQMHDDPVSPVLVEFLHELEKLGVDVDDMGPGIGLSILEHMDEYLENLMPEEEAIPDDDDDLVIDIDAHAPRPRTFATLSRMPSSTHPSDPSFHPASQARASSPLTGPGGSQDAHDSQGSKTTFADTVQLVPKEDLMEKFAIVREKLNSPKSSAKCKNQACKGIRVASARFKNDEQAQSAVKLLSGDHYRVIDPYVVKEFDLFTMTLEEYQATCHYQQKPVLRKMRLYRAPLNYVPSNAPSSPVPIDPYWLGFWLGGGNKHKPLVSSSDLEIKVYCQTYVDRLNRERAPGVVGLHLAEEVVSKAGDSRLVPGGYTAICTVTTYNWTISLDSRGDRNPIIQGLRDLGLYKDKSGGIPDCYMNADEETRLAVLAGLIESDGTLSQRTNVYCFSQTTYEHKKISEDAQKLATSCGIQCTPVSESQYQDRREPTWRFWMSKGSEKFQHHLLIPRKRLDVSKVINRQNRDIRGFDVEDAGEGEYRLIEVSGGLYQLADRTVVHNCTLGDTPAMYKVGMILLKGLLGQPRNPRDAISWLKRAAERADADNPHALHELGLLYESAEGNDALVRDEAYAFQLFKQAADLGYKFSQYRMGAAYEYGLMGVPVDARLSIMWYSRAATQEEHQSELALSGWYLTGSEGVLQQSDTEAYLWARKAAMAGLAKAEYAMGYFTEVGIGVPANLEDAKRWYWRAAAQDFPKARKRLEDLKRSGKTGPRQRERISRSRIERQQEGECVVM